MTYEVKLQTFSGPLEKLLALIEEKHLEVTRLSLSDVTEDFLTYIKKLGEEAPPAEIADFLVVAARLLLIKSKVLLPELALTDEEEGEIHDLEARLAIYREFSAHGARAGALQGIASRALAERWGKGVAWGRPLFLSVSAGTIFYPAPQITKDALTQALERALALVQEFLPKTSEVKGIVVRLEEKISELLNRFREAIAHSFQGIAKDRSKGEVVVLFLALLHLLKERSVSVSQDEQFGDIIVRKTGE